MSKYLVEISETSEREIIVSVDTHDESEQKVRQKYQDEEIVLDERDYIDTDFHIIKERSIDKER